MPREVGEWTKDKLKILELYLPGYLGATTTAVERVYIDGFAGPGLNRIKRTGEIFNGSPLSALEAQARNGTSFDRLFFIESDPETVRELAELVRSHDLGDKAQVIQGDVNKKLPEVLGQINRRSPIFLLLDTEGIDPRWETIVHAAEWQTELLINFPLGMSINRNPDSPKVTEYFGTDAWRDLWDGDRRSRTAGLLDLYRKRLFNLGYTYQSDNSRLVRDDGNRNLYYLVFASKVEPAKTIMNWVYAQPDAQGQTRLSLEFDAE